MGEHYCNKCGKITIEVELAEKYNNGCVDNKGFLCSNCKCIFVRVTSYWRLEKYDSIQVIPRTITKNDNHNKRIKLDSSGYPDIDDDGMLQYEDE